MSPRTTKPVSTDKVFRRARADEADLLNEMTLAGIRFWGHHQSHPTLYEELASSLPTPAEVEANPVFVVEADGEVVAFYELRNRGDHVELLRMFQKVELIGQGYGRMMWEHCVHEAAKLGNRMRVVSDPESVGFYAAMGAFHEETKEVAPGFSLGVFWYELA